jgi:transcriptional regulator with XRE-family HTH domain
MNSRKEILEAIIKARMEKGLTQTELAGLIGTQRSNISRLESGAHNPSLDFVLKVFDALGIKSTFAPEENSNIYEIKLYDTNLITFSLSKVELLGLSAKIIKINDSKRSQFPIDLDLSNEGLLRWLEKRVIPKNRTFVDEILKTLKLSVNDTKGIIDVCKGLSLNDSFWVVPQGFSGKFAEYNLYENRFSEILSLVAYTGIGQSNPAFTTSPELTTNGMLPKAWRYIENDGIYLYKGGSFGAANTGNEPYNEFYACQIAEAMGLNSVHYDLENWKGILASRCKLFTDIDTAFIPIGRIIRSGGLKPCLDYYDELGKDFSEQVRSMLLFDAIIYNEDRHFGNFGLLRNNKTGKIIAPAPIFDNGLSLFNYGLAEDFKNLAEYAKTRAPAYGGISFEEIAKSVMGKLQKSQIKKLIGFEFTMHKKLNFSAERLNALQEYLQIRIRELMNI